MQNRSRKSEVQVEADRGYGGSPDDRRLRPVLISTIGGTMDQVLQFLAPLWPFLLAVLGGTLLPMIFAKWVPNEKWHQWGFSAGKKLSEKGVQFFGAKSWEQLENSMLGSFAAFVQGVTEGANEDD